MPIQRPTAATTKPAATAGKAPAARETKASNAAVPGRYSGMKAAAARYPLMGEFEGDLEVIKTYETKNPKTGAWFHADFKIISSNAPPESPFATGKNCSFLKSIKETAIETTGPMVVSFVVGTSGFESDDAFFEHFDGSDADHPLADDLLNAVSGAPSPVKANPLEGQRVHVFSYPTDERYFGQNWTPYTESESAEVAW
jgi:hypothetical protein